MENRIASIDIFRGIAILQLIFWQIFDFFAKSDIYTQSPYYIAIFNMPINGIGVAMFAFISGVSVYISVSKKLDKGEKKSAILFHALKRYGGYILISLLFTTFVFGFKTFYTWNEAIQGIGLAALVTALIVLLARKKWVLIPLSLAIIFTQGFLRQFLETGIIPYSFPYNPISFNLFYNIIPIFLNFTSRGFFSLSNLLPIALFGAALSFFIIKLNPKKLTKTSFLIGLPIASVSIIFHFMFDKINYYNRSTSYLLFYIGLSFLLFGLANYLSIRFEKNKIMGYISLFGKTSIIAYLFHYSFIYKPLKILGYESAFSSPISYFFTIAFIVIIYHICKAWLRNKHIIFNKIRKIYIP